MPDISAPGKVASAQAAPIKPAAIAEASAVRPDPAPAPVRNTSGFNDGSYSAQGNYRTPDGTESIGVTLALKDGVITDASIEQTGYARESRRYQSRFAESFKQYVVGRSISSLSLSRVSGASLTTIGFNNALQQITAEARG